MMDQAATASRPAIAQRLFEGIEDETGMSREPAIDMIGRAVVRTVLPRITPAKPISRIIRATA